MFNCELGNQQDSKEDIQRWEQNSLRLGGLRWCRDQRQRRSYPPALNGMTHYKFNPKKNSHWFTDTHDNRDGTKFNITEQTKSLWLRQEEANQDTDHTEAFVYLTIIDHQDIVDVKCREC